MTKEAAAIVSAAVSCTKTSCCALQSSSGQVEVLLLPLLLVLFLLELLFSPLRSYYSNHLHIPLLLRISMGFFAILSP